MMMRFRSMLPLFFVVSMAFAREAAVNDHDFGAVPQGRKLAHAFVIRNPEDVPLRIERVEANVPGISARFQPVIAAGGEGRVDIEWDTAKAAGPVEATLDVRTSGAALPDIALHVKALVQPSIEFSPYPAVFFSAYQDERPEERIRIVNHREAPLRIEDIQYPKDHFEAAVEEIEPGRVYELRVRVRPDVPLGRYREQISLTTNQPEHAHLLLGANLLVKPDFYAFPEVIDFGSLRLETLDREPKLLALLTQTTVLTNRSGPVEIRSVTSDLPFLRLSRSPESGKESRFRLDVAPVLEQLKPGKIAGSIRVLTDDPLHPEVVIPVKGEVQ